MKRLGLALAFVIISGCKQQIDLTIFASDIVTVADSGAQVDANAIIGVNTLSAANCSARQGDVKRALSAGFRNVEFVGCTTRGVETFAEYRVRVPITAPDQLTESAAYIGTTRRNGVIPVVLQIAPGAFAQMTAALPKDMQNPLDQKIEIVVTLTIQNDLPDAVIISVNSVFLDGAPYPQGHEVTLPRRGEIRIALSDVANAALSEGAAPLFALLP